MTLGLCAPTGGVHAIQPHPLLLRILSHSQEFVNDFLMVQAARPRCRDVPRPGAPAGGSWTICPTCTIIRRAAIPGKCTAYATYPTVFPNRARFVDGSPGLGVDLPCKYG